MPKARTKRGKLRQQEHWLREHFPTPHPVVVTARRFTAKEMKECSGLTHRKGRRFHISLNMAYPYHTLHDALNHEWAHAMTWPPARIEDYHPHHNAAWGIAYAAIHAHWADDNGFKESWAYPDK